MKFKIFIIIVTLLINSNCKCFAKYVFDNILIAAELNIDRTLPEAEIIEKYNTNTGYEKYANSTHEITFKIKIYDNNKIIKKSEVFEILVGTNESKGTKEVKILSEQENYIIYQIKLTNIKENGQLFIKIPTNSFEDDSKNIMEEQILNTEILIDNIPPIVKYEQNIQENGKVLASIISNEAVRKIDGWMSEDSNKIISKEFISDIKYHREIKDLAGNISTVEIDVNDSTYLGLEVKAHMSSSAWQNTDSDIIGRMEKGNYKYKFESLLFRTGNNVSKDYLQVSGYVHTYWGDGNYAKSGQFGIIYNHGYNPVSGYKTMLNSELVNYQEKEYIHLGGEGINYQGATDINGNNPIPVNIAIQYKFGISGIKLDLKEHNENTIIYQIFFDDTGWIKTCKNGEIAMRAENEPIEAMRIAVIPNSEVDTVIQEWDEDIGTYNSD